MTTAHRTTTRVVTLAKRPAGAPEPADFALEERPVRELSSGQLLVRNAFMSVDPSMRGRLEETEKHYTSNFRVGEPLDGSALLYRFLTPAQAWRVRPILSQYGFILVLGVFLLAGGYISRFIFDVTNLLVGG